LLVQTNYHEAPVVSTPKISGAPFTEAELAAWHGMLTLYSGIMRDLDRDLTASHRISIREFDVLITLYNALEHRLRMSELADSVLLSPSGVSRLVDRLGREGLVERRSYEGDARSIQAILTDLGAERLDEARTTHNAVIRAHFTDHLTSNELRELGALWQRVLSESR
jgi:DNA-binding MarR family transcriptional regulator